MAPAPALVLRALRARKTPPPPGAHPTAPCYPTPTAPLAVLRRLPGGAGGMGRTPGGRRRLAGPAAPWGRRAAKQNSEPGAKGPGLAIGCRKSGLRHFFEVFIAPLRLRRGQGAMQRNPCYARLFADLPYTPPNPIIASGGCGPRTPKGFSTGCSEPGAKGPGLAISGRFASSRRPPRRVFRQRQKGSANSSPAPPHPGKGGSGREPVSQGHGTRNAVRKGHGAGSTPWAKPGPTRYGPGRNSPPRRGLRPQVARARWCATIAARAGPPPAQGRRPRRAAVRAGQL